MYLNIHYGESSYLKWELLYPSLWWIGYFFKVDISQTLSFKKHPHSVLIFRWWSVAPSCVQGNKHLISSTTLLLGPRVLNVHRACLLLHLNTGSKCSLEDHALLCVCIIFQFDEYLKCRSLYAVLTTQSGGINAVPQRCYCSLTDLTEYTHALWTNILYPEYNKQLFEILPHWRKPDWYGIRRIKVVAFLWLEKTVQLFSFFELDIISCWSITKFNKQVKIFRKERTLSLTVKNKLTLG